MKRRCPFCWGNSIRSVRTSAGESLAASPFFLLECPECEKWFWAHSGEDVPRLYEVCETAARDPDRCYPELREAVLRESLSPSRQAEFNFLCSQCGFRTFHPGSGMWIVTG